MTKKILSLIIAAIMMFGIFGLAGCPANPDNYTEAQHIKRISKRIETRLINEEKGYTDFEVYPLYNQNEKLIFFLVELEPIGYVFVCINHERIIGETMYSYDTGSSDIFDSFDYSQRDPWRRYTITEEGLAWQPTEGHNPLGRSWPNEYKNWETDENGEYIYYDKSPYYEAGIENEQLYFLKEPYHWYIPAVKRGDKWLNLISMEEMDLSEEITSKKYADIAIHFISKPNFNL